MKPTHVLAGLLPLLLIQAHCGPREPARSQAVPPPPIDEKALPVIPVHPESLQGVDEARILHQLGGEGSRLPVRIAGKEVEYPPDHPPWGGQPGTLIVEVVIAPDGRIGRFKVLRGPQDEILNRALADALREWRFRPAMLRGEAVAVFYTLAIRVNERST